MKKITTVLLIALLLTAPQSFSAKTFDQLAHEILETLQEFHPVHATEMGIHAYDHRFTDYSSPSVKEALKKFNNFEKELYRYKDANIPIEQKIDYKLLKAEVDMEIYDLKRIKWHERNPQIYVNELIDGIYFLLLSDHAPLSEKVVQIVNRMKAVPPFLATAKKNLKKPDPVYIRAANESLESAIRFYKSVAGELMNKFPERADNILKVSTAAREAMSDFQTYLSTMTPGPEMSFAIGKENFDYMLSNLYFLPYDSDSLLKIGEALFEEVDSLYRDYAVYVEEEHQNGTDSVFVPANFTKQDILNYYNWEAEQEKIFLQEYDLITIPENIAPLKVIETPPFLRTMVSGIAYQPAGPFDSVQTGLFYVRPIPDDLDRKQLESRYRYVQRRGFKASVVHEGYPGHHLMTQICGMNQDPVRKWSQNMLLIEGWALYCEQMMYEQGLYGQEDPTMWLNTLGGIRFRAARIIADVKLHTGQFSYDDCVNWMTEALDIDTDSGQEYIKKEVTRYTMTPTIPMSYLIGKTEIMKLRDAYMEQQGVDFEIADFHDKLLAEGAISPILLYEIWGL